MDEWVMERYELAKERIAQIPDEKMAEEPYCDFFTKEAMFLQQVIHVMDHGIAVKNLEELQEQNHELYQEILNEWQTDENVRVDLTIDRPQEGWDGHVGFIPSFVEELKPDLSRTVLLCGHPIMIKFTLDGMK